MIRRAHDRHQLAGVQPVQLTRRTIVDHDVSRAGVVVNVHGAVALGALNAPLQLLGIGRMRDGLGIPLMRPKVTQYQNKDRRGNQIATAAGAIENLVRLENGMNQRNSTNRASKL
jgi:hypothetical protein